jgi:hypothetical protein
MNSTLLLAASFGLIFARAARAQEAPSAEDRLAAALESVMTDEVVDAVGQCSTPDYAGWTTVSRPGAMFFDCVRRPGERTGDAKAFLPTDAVQKALAAQGLSYYVDYSIYDVATKTVLDRAAVERAAARAVEHQKALKAMNGAGAALPKS